MKKVKESVKKIEQIVSKSLTKNIVKKLIVFLSIFLVIVSIVELFSAAYGIFVAGDFMSVLKAVRFIILAISAYTGFKTAKLKDNPEIDRKYALIFALTLVVWLVIYLGEQLVSMLVSKSTYEELYENQVDFQNIFGSFGVFYALYIFITLVFMGCALSCCGVYLMISYLNIRYTAKDIDAPYRMVKTEDEDSDVVFNINEEELQENNEEIEFNVDAEKPKINVEEKEK